MPGKYVKIGSVWKPVANEYVKIAGAWKPVTANWVKVGGAWKGIPFAKYIFACEQFSDRLYGLDDTPTDLVGWPVIAGVTDPVDVACDNHGNSYYACANGVVKVNLAGTILWTYTGHGTTVLSVCVDADDNVYSGDFSGVVKKLNSSGIQQWTKTLGANYSVYALAVDYSSGQLYAGTGFAHDAIYRLLTVNGNSALIYTSTHGDITGIGIDELSPTSLYVGTNAGYLMKMSTAGYIYWGDTGTICTDVHNVRVGHDGYGYCATGAGGTYGKSLYKFDLSTGNRVWSYAVSGADCAMGCAVDQFGNVYGTWYKVGTSVYNTVRKVNSSGVLQWSWQPYVSAQFYGVCVSPGIKAAGM